MVREYEINHKSVGLEIVEEQYSYTINEGGRNYTEEVSYYPGVDFTI